MDDYSPDPAADRRFFIVLFVGLFLLGLFVADIYIWPVKYARPQVAVVESESPKHIVAPIIEPLPPIEVAPIIEPLPEPTLEPLPSIILEGVQELQQDLHHVRNEILRHAAHAKRHHRHHHRHVSYGPHAPDATTNTDFAAPFLFGAARLAGAIW